MSEDQPGQESRETEKVKTCPQCQGTWPAERSHCLACGASLADVPARPPVEDPNGGQINWRILDALSPDSDPGPGDPAGSAPPPKERKGRWWEFWR